MKWIKVEDQKPESNQVVIGYGGPDDGRSFAYVAYDEIEDEWFIAENFEGWVFELDQTECYGLDDAFYVHSWMPLPEPPEE